MRLSHQTTVPEKTAGGDDLSFVPMESTLTRKQSLEVLSLRVSDLLEGLGDERDGTNQRPQDAQHKFVRFRQKLEKLLLTGQRDSTVRQERPAETTEALLTELDEIGNYVTKKHHRHVSSAFLGELVETMQALLQDTMPPSPEDSPHAEAADLSLRHANPLLTRIGDHIKRLANKGVSITDVVPMQEALQSVQDEVERFGSYLNKLQQERNDLVRLVSSGQEIMGDLVKENESLEHQLTLHIMSQKKTLIGDHTEVSRHTEPKEASRARTGSCNEDDLLRLVFKEKTKAEMLERQANHLAIQASTAQKELEELKVQRMDVMDALDQETWLEDRDRLLQMLEDEKDKVSTWREEQEELVHQLKLANEKINVLEEESEQLRQAAEATSWAEYRQSLLQQAEASEEKINSLAVTCEEAHVRIDVLEEKKLKLELENGRLTEELKGGAAWEKQELSWKLTVAEKQNRLLEVMAENEEIQGSAVELQTRLEEAHAEIESLTKQLDEVAWAEDREALMQALEAEIDRRPMWEEERTSLEQQVASLTEETDSLRTENATLAASCDAVSWAREREELCRALEEEKEKLSSWTEELEALEEENKHLKWVFHESKEKDLVIRDKEEAIEQLNDHLENLQSRMYVREDEIQQLRSILESTSEDWIQEKVSLIDQVAELKLSRASLEESLKQVETKHHADLIRIEELEIELDRLERERLAIKSATARKHVGWGSMEMSETALVGPPCPLSINVGGSSHKRFDSGGGSVQEAVAAPPAQMRCHLSVRVPHLRSKSIPPSVQF